MKRRTSIVSPPSSRPTFLWRGLLIVLPVGMLVVFGVWSLRQDRRLIEAEARERAQQFADQAVERCWRELRLAAGANAGDAVSNTLASPTDTAFFRISTAGQLIVPRDYPKVPMPQPVDVSRLGPESAVLWQRTELAGATNASGASRIAAVRAFLGSRPPPEFAALAHFRLAALLRQTDRQTASQEYLAVIAQFPDSVGETGLPLAPLAELQRADLALVSPGGAPAGWRATLNDLASNAVTQPSLLTPTLLVQAAQWEQRALGSTNVVAYWQGIWQVAEHQRHLYRCVVRALSPPEDPIVPPKSWPEVCWFHDTQYPPAAKNKNDQPGAAKSQAGESLVFREGVPGASRYRCLGPSQLAQALTAFGQAEQGLPEYLGVEYELAGCTFGGFPLVPASPEAHSRRRSSPTGFARPIPMQANPVLASAVRRGSDGTPLLTVAVILLDPSALYARQQQRLLWFGGLIAAAAVVAMVGLMSAWSAFQRQQRLYEQQSNFVSSVTHELRAPIAAVRLMAENLQRGKVAQPAEQRQFYDYIVQECCRLSAMIENVLNLARIEQGRQQYEFEPADIVRLVESVVQLMEPNAAEGRVALKLELDPTQFAAASEPPVLDSRAVRQALINLIDNALKHSPPGATVTVGVEGGEWIDRLVDSCGKSQPPPHARPPINPSIHLSNNPAPRASLRLWVRDEGPGIPAAEHEKIFERFYRLGSELRRETPGVGIGLSIVQHIVEAHRGRVWVESEVGKGSRFVLDLPLQQS